MMRGLVFLHRWLGVGLCLFVLVWFATGIGMMYWDFPAVTDRDRLARSPALDASAIVLSPQQAYAALRLAAPPDDARLGTFDLRPVYRFRAGRALQVVYADTGEPRTEASAASMRRVAARWSGQREQDAASESIDAVDQWTVQGPLRTLRPLWKYSWPDGQQVYVSQASGDVVQYTTTASRVGAYFGAIPHWLYFTPLRKHQPQWSRFVIWTSGIGTATALLGIVVGLWMYVPTTRAVFGSM